MVCCSLALFAVAGTSYAERPSVPKKHFLFRITGKYSSQFFKIYQKNGAWVCNSESVPFFEARKNPLESLDWNSVAKSSADLKNCRDKVLIEDQLLKPGRKAAGCLSEPPFKQLADEIYRACTP
ncbi:MAG: hypothetical protein A2428_03310 [Bdellovibrionales bacterium RIFOXYC1_FULL_54_43]|nr:MAG: hypothetical protein A2428_03310 [Bdellovibrionales bacterium RIFOXYC1_FULL_54_43]OFZ81156.1 MAG: hypothetical protein A2603_14245 [Bdellovibrionales bacterium RIFOXYD1_FULL_55_31]